MLSAIVVAAGSSQRMGFDKLGAALRGRPVLVWTLAAFQACEAVGEIVLLTRAGNEVELTALCAREGFTKVREVLPGGAARHLSVWNGLQALAAEARFVAVHDGARPLVTPALIERCLVVAETTGAACAAVPVTDTLKRADAAGRIVGGVDRTGLWAMQTPQIFSVPLLRRAYEAVLAADVAVTDEASALEHLGEPVALVDHEEWNLKITYPRDLALAAQLLELRAAGNVGPAGTGA